MPQPWRFSMTLQLIIATTLLLFVPAGSPPWQLRDGDILFQTVVSDQGIAIRKATHSKYNHMGIVFFQRGEPYVDEAYAAVHPTPLAIWIARGEGGHFVAKRLRDADRVLTPEAVGKLKEAAAAFAGKPYDWTFEWSDDRLYCSELVWKIYYRALGIRIGRLQRLRDFDLTDPLVRNILRARFGNDPPLDERVISPAAIFSSRKLVVVAGHLGRPTGDPPLKRLHRTLRCTSHRMRSDLRRTPDPRVRKTGVFPWLML